MTAPFAFEQNLVTDTVVTAADLSAYQFYAVKLNSSSQLVLCSVAGEASYGILTNKTRAFSGESGAVAYAGIVKAKASAAIAAGAKVSVAASGKLRTAVSGDYILGWARTAAGADGDDFALTIERMGILP